MATGREKSQWEQVSLLASICANPYRDSKKRPEPYTPADFNPFASKKSAKAGTAATRKWSMEEVKNIIMASVDQRR